MIPIEFVYGLALGLGLAAALYLLLWYQARRAGLGNLPPPGAVGVLATPEEDWSEPTHPTPVRVALATPLTVAPASLAVALARPDVVTAAHAAPRPAPEPERNARPTHRPSIALETLRLSQRVLLHVYSQGELPPGAVAPPGLCQAGMVEALGIPQAGLAAVLSRLEAAGMFSTERGHVRGHDRRLKIYRLSSRGLQVAQELRRRNARGPPR